MAVLAENSTQLIRFNKPRNKNQPITSPNPKPKTHIPKSNSFTLFRFVCGTSSPASAPEAIRPAAEWEAKKAKKQKRRKKKRSSVKETSNGSATSRVVVEVVSDVFCAPPGVGFSAGDAFVDCVELRRRVARRRPRKHSVTARRDNFPILDSPNAKPYQHFSRGLSQNMMSERFDHFGKLRLDVDNMSYEELLDLSDRIGYVGTGLREEKIFRCLRKARLPDLDSIPLLPHTDLAFKCSICQDEYEADDEVGKLGCGHYYHVGCIKPWLLQKNSCPICKAAADG